MYASRLQTILFTLSCAVFAGSAHAATVTFLHFNDLHAHLTPHTDRVAVNNTTVLVEKGGLARLSGLVKQIRKDTPSAILMNIGDTYHGGAEALFTNGNAIVDPVNALKIDVGVAGNWDFAYGPAVTRLRYAALSPMEQRALEMVAGPIKRPVFPNLAANVTYTAPLWKAGQTLMPPTLLKEINGVKVGFIGITSDIVPEMHKMMAAGLSFLQGEQNHASLLEHHASALRAQGAQLVVVMSELGIHKDYRLADVVSPGSVDVFFSAHTHELTATPLQGRSGALVVEAGNDGWLGRMDVTITSGSKPKFKWQTLPIDASVPEDQEMKKLVAAARAPFLVADPNLQVPLQNITLTLRQPLTAVVGHTNGSLDRRDSLESSFNDSWAEALRNYAGTQFALTPGFRFDAVTPGNGSVYEDGHVATGDITVEDVYRFFPVPYTMATGLVDGARLKQVIDDNLSAVYSLDNFSQHGGWTDGWAGLHASIDLSAADGARVNKLYYPNGSEIAAGDVLSIAGCQRPMDDPDVLCSYPGMTSVSPMLNPASGTPWYVQDLFTKLLGKGYVNTVATPVFTDLASTPLWPEQPLVQPLAVEVSNKVTFKQGRISNRSDLGLYVTTVEITNDSPQAIGIPLKLGIEGLPTGVTVSNASGTLHGAPYLKLDTPLAAGAKVTVTVWFNNPNHQIITYQPHLYSGGV